MEDVYTREKKNEFLQSQEWFDLRYATFEAQGRRCRLCGCSQYDGPVIQVDHIVPMSKAWHRRADPTNLQVLCRPCNLGKSNRSSADFREPPPPLAARGPAKTKPKKEKRTGCSPRSFGAFTFTKLYFQMTPKIAEKIKLSCWTDSHLLSVGIKPPRRKGWISELMRSRLNGVMWQNAYDAIRDGRCLPPAPC